MSTNCQHYVVSIGESFVSQPPDVSGIFFSNGWQLLVQIILAYYAFPSTLDYKCSFNYLQL